MHDARPLLPQHDATAHPVTALQSSPPKLDDWFFSIETIVRIDEEAVELQRILTEGLLFPVFQPILDFRVRAILGYESLIRGPEDSPLHRPDSR